MDFVIVRFYSVHSTIVIEGEIQYEEFTLMPETSSIIISGKYRPIGRVEVKINLINSTTKELDFLERKLSTDDNFNLYFLAKQRLETFFYKLSSLSNSYIYLNYPVYIQFSTSSQLYRIDKPTDFSLKPLTIPASEIDAESLYKAANRGNPVTLAVDSLKPLNRILKKHLHLCYLYYVLINNQLDLNLRLLSAWKYLEEYVELQGHKVAEYKIPDCIFNTIYGQSTIEVPNVTGIADDGGVWVHTHKYQQQFLEDFRKEIRLPIAHHKRDEKPRYGITEKKYTPGRDIRHDLRMRKALHRIIPFVSQLNKDLFQFPSPQIDKTIKRTSKYVSFPQRL